MSCSNASAASFVYGITGGVNQQYDQGQMPQNHGNLEATVINRPPAPFQGAFGAMSGGKRRHRSMRMKRQHSRRKPRKHSRRKHTRRTRKMRR